MANTTKNRSKSETSKRSDFDGRVPPNNFEAEQAVLGSALIDPEAAILVVGKLEENDFYNQTHRNIFKAICELTKNAKPVDFLTVADELEKEGQINDVGGIGYVQSLTTIVPSSASCAHYAEIVKRNSVLRQIIGVCGDTISSAYGENADERILGEAEKAFYDIGEKGQNGSLEKLEGSIEKVLTKFEDIQKNNAPKGLKTGFYQIDKIVNGLQRSDLIIIAARPGVGKTSLAMNIVSNAALNYGAKCAVFSLEMSKEQLTQRMLCSVANVSMAKALRGELSPEEWTKLSKAEKKLKGAEIYVDDNALNTPSKVLSKCRKLKRDKGLDLVVIDYIGLMKADERTESRQNEVASISRQLKILAKEINVPVITLSQLNRSVEQRPDGKPGKPRLSDLRESGSIEQDADMVWFIHRDMTKSEAIEAENTNSNYIAEIIIAKFRNGQTGSVFLNWDGSRTSFVNLEKDANEQSLVDAYQTLDESKKAKRAERTAEDFNRAISGIVNHLSAEGYDENANYYDESIDGLVPPPESSDENSKPDFSNVEVKDSGSGDELYD